MNDSELGLVVDALKGWADTRRRAAERAAVDVDAQDRAGKDMRSSSRRVTRTLAEAAILQRTADALISGQLLLTGPPAPAADTQPAASKSVSRREKLVDEGRARRAAERRAKAEAAEAAESSLGVDTDPDGEPAPAANLDVKTIVLPDGTTGAAIATGKGAADGEDPLTGAADEDEPTPAEIAEAAGGASA
jgi:hypothetical protein